MPVTILGIESSCDDTSAAVVRDGYLLSNLIANQNIHRKYGGVVPELASRAHQANIVPVVDQALREAGITVTDIDAVAFTRGPGLLGSLLVGVSFAKGLSLSASIPVIEVNHLQAHILVHFIKDISREGSYPEFPFLCLLVSGGHTQLVIVRDYLKMELIGQTIDDAAGEAFDKCAKIMGLPYPGGPVIDKLAKDGRSNAFRFSKPVMQGLDFSFSGLKTNFLYFIRERLLTDPGFIENNKSDLAASLQETIVSILTEKLVKAVSVTGIKRVAVAGGVSANSGLRAKLEQAANLGNWEIFIPEFRFTTDNAAMIAITGFYKYIRSEFTALDAVPVARYGI
ncbi:MAG: tRNA (adenosine(37)-N6)-threonylcarbamoyltransferase complex transferase subunit TsaD [Bacteroidetes bacterium]|nr:tRNA (adenosine(37)-N6)-threonylcarbamoyltransferase complex transferase subunit TsaD [Bacteroidota bacterium]